MTTETLKLRHEIYSILTNPDNRHQATNDHLHELTRCLFGDWTGDTSTMQILKQASEQYLALEGE